jgi:hypothetical protein
MHHDAAASAEVNRLYWETDESVADIAGRLEMSRRALYDAVEPLLTGAACEVCGGPLAFENRSARTAGEPSCAVCSEVGTLEMDPPLVQPPPALDDDGRALTVGGAALAGAAIGALLTLALVPRR